MRVDHVVFAAGGLSAPPRVAVVSSCVDPARHIIEEAVLDSPLSPFVIRPVQSSWHGAVVAS